jgi:hypothetical protein
MHEDARGLRNICWAVFVGGCGELPRSNSACSCFRCLESFGVAGGTLKFSFAALFAVKVGLAPQLRWPLSRLA